MANLSRRWPVVLLLLAPVLALWRCLARGESIGPFDQIRQMAPWNGPRPDQPWDVLQADGVLQFYAWRDLVFSSWGQGVVPAWNPYVLAGTPLLANSQSGALYPLHILLGLLHVPTGLALVLLAWIHLAVAGLGLYVLVRNLGGTQAGGVVAGILGGLSPFMLAWAPLPSVITTVAWFPWVMAGIAGLLAGGDLRRSGLMAGLGTGLMLLGGHLQFAAYGLLGSLVFGITLAVAGRKRTRGLKPVGVGVAAVALGCGLAAAQVLPVLNFSQFSHRRAVPTVEGYSAYLGSALKPNDLVSRVANPYGQGDPAKYVDPNAPFSQFWPLLSRRAPYAESALTLGPLALILLCLLGVTRTHRSAALALGIVGLVGLLLALGTPLNALLYFNAPGWSATGSPGRAICLFVLPLCALAGLAVPAEPSADRRRVGIAVGAGALLCLVTLAPQLDPVPQGFNAEAFSTIGAAASGEAPLFLLAVVIAAVGAFVGATRSAGGAAVFVGAAVLSGLVLHVPRLVRTGDPSFLHQAKSPSAGARVAVINPNWEMFQATPALYPPNTLTPSRVHELSGYDSLLHRDTVARMAQVNAGKDPAPPANGNMMLVKPDFDPAALAEAGVSEIWVRGQEGVDRIPVEGPGRFGNATWIREDLSGLTLRVTGPQRLVLRDRNMPGWTASVDQKPVSLGEGLWREVEVPEGEHEVTFRYSPPGLATGGIVSVISLVLLLGLVAALGRSRKAPAGEESVGS